MTQRLCIHQHDSDSLSPLLFCLAMNPLSDILHETGRSYVLKNGQKISHLLYIDDIKLYGRTENDINSLINATQIYSEDIKMKFGVKKCARLIVRRGKVVPTEGLEVVGGHIPDVSEEGYKYSAFHNVELTWTTSQRLKSQRSIRRD